jgi:hypothetical protein
MNFKDATLFRQAALSSPTAKRASLIQRVARIEAPAEPALELNRHSKGCAARADA